MYMNRIVLQPFSAMFALYNILNIYPFIGLSIVYCHMIFNYTYLLPFTNSIPESGLALFPASPSSPQVNNDKHSVTRTEPSLSPLTSVYV